MTEPTTAAERREAIDEATRRTLLLMSARFNRCAGGWRRTATEADDGVTRAFALGRAYGYEDAALGLHEAAESQEPATQAPASGPRWAAALEREAAIFCVYKDPRAKREAEILRTAAKLVRTEQDARLILEALGWSNPDAVERVLFGDEEEAVAEDTSASAVSAQRPLDAVLAAASRPTLAAGQVWRLPYGTEVHVEQRPGGGFVARGPHRLDYIDGPEAPPGWSFVRGSAERESDEQQTSGPVLPEPDDEGSAYDAEAAERMER